MTMDELSDYIPIWTALIAAGAVMLGSILSLLGTWLTARSIAKRQRSAAQADKSAELERPAHTTRVSAGRKSGRPE